MPCPSLVRVLGRAHFSILVKRLCYDTTPRLSHLHDCFGVRSIAAYELQGGNLSLAVVPDACMSCECMRVHGEQKQLEPSGTPSAIQLVPICYSTENPAGKSKTLYGATLAVSLTARLRLGVCIRCFTKCVALAFT